MDEQQKLIRKRELARRYGLDDDQEIILDALLELEEELERAARENRKLTDEYNKLERSHKNVVQWIHDLKEPPNEMYYVVRNEPDKNRAIVSDGRGMVIYSYGLKMKEEKQKVKPGMRVVVGAAPTPVKDAVTGEFLRDPETGDIVIKPVKSITEILYGMETQLPRVRLSKIEDGSLYGLRDDDIAVFEVTPNNIVTQKIPKSQSAELKKLKNVEVDLYMETMDIARVVKDAQKVDVTKSVQRITYGDIGGMDNVIEQVREIVEIPIRHPDVYEKLGIDPPKGILFYGPPGTGKTMLAKAIANEAGLNYYSFSGAEVMDKYYGESEARLRKIFEEAVQHAPSIVFIDELDALAPKREDTQEVERRVVAQLLALMDGLESRGKVIVLGATNRVDDLDPAVRRPGRFDKEIELTTPSEEGRHQILQIHTRKASLADDVNLKELSSILHGYTGADIKMLVTQAGINALRRNKSKILSGEGGSADEYKLTRADFMGAYENITPTSMREIHLEIPNIKWSDIGGLDQAKQELMEAIEWPLKYKELYKHAKMKAPKGILLYGPPGTGKTLLAKAVATESNVNFVTIRGPELYSKWVGESEKAIRDLFKRARQSKPCIILFDEIDSLATKRGSISGDSGVSDKVLSQLLAEMDGMENTDGVYIIGTTNKPQLIDDALLRPGRFDQKIEIAIPDEKTRYEIFKIHTKNRILDKELDLKLYVEETEGYSGADIEYVCRRSAELAMRDFIAKYGDDAETRHEEFRVTKVYFDKAIEEMRSKSGYSSDNSYKKGREEDLPSVEA